MRYRMIGIDLDGTLLDGKGQLSQSNRDAIARAIDEDILIVPCTGRAWHESHFVLDDVPGLQEGVFVTGAAINRMDNGDLVDDAPLTPDMAWDLVRLMQTAPDPVLVFNEISKAGHHYLVAGEGDLRGNTDWWFQFTSAVVQHEPEVAPDHVQHTLRVGVVTSKEHAAELESQVLDQMGDTVVAHAFEAIVRDVDEPLHILEVFGPDTDKWQGMRRIAQHHGIAEEEIAVIGDSVNDLPMLRGASCSIAMANGIPAARDLADFITTDNNSAGVAHAIDQLLSEAWG